VSGPSFKLIKSESRSSKRLLRTFGVRFSMAIERSKSNSMIIINRVEGYFSITTGIALESRSSMY